MQFENNFNFDGNVPWKNRHSNRTSSPNPILFAPDLPEKLAATIDHFRMFKKLRRAIHHSQRLDDTLNFVEAAEVGPEGGENREADLARGGFSLL